MPDHSYHTLCVSAHPSSLYHRGIALPLGLCFFILPESLFQAGT